ncbi:MULTISPECIES: tRNA pseudouridine(54/55) synthase Pus10 [unclassified Methanosarcina]|uniref:tRNA pseudouridine(54/55) synthase Pus10 n=1 Tax=unclassified Methanosarcina TaxID=2644672 RepID=UPI00061543A7|nr:MULTISPECIES: tRNA pseudouridine(54/55) synthase Pus10 [unclassified Methanosarcina]AKB20072.1 tRNA pseudouridine 55 synthase Archaea [Methanosarcina sp. WWM596]AKB21642.1 tRNA pseudouridine 55 synthase Archaea [Methanosarcina sp. WH1]
MDVLEISKKILHEGPVCDHCMGRQFAKLSTGLSNRERGQAMKLALVLEGDRIYKSENDDSLLKELVPCSALARKTLRIEGEDEQCWVCLDQFKKLDEWADKAAKALEGLEYSTFLVGTKVSGLLSENEEMLWAEAGTAYAEQLKTELNREVGKRIAEKVDKEVDFENPDIVITLDLATTNFELQVRSVYVYGRYLKKVRGIPQTRWPCRKCKGRGCESCGFTGKQYPESVDELIKGPVIETFEAVDTAFHGSGREDIDALMLGNGRPFVVEAKSPVKRMADLEMLTALINENAAGKVEVRDLRFVEKSMIEILKSSKADKTYKLKVTFKEPVSEEKLKSCLESLSGTEIAQQTPKRVVHRRADLVRKRHVHSITLDELTDNGHAHITVNCEGGLYVKELISGDEGRTNPSLTGLLGVPALVEDLDVVNVEI